MFADFGKSRLRKVTKSVSKITRPAAKLVKKVATPKGLLTVVTAGAALPVFAAQRMKAQKQHAASDQRAAEAEAMTTPALDVMTEPGISPEVTTIIPVPTQVPPRQSANYMQEMQKYFQRLQEQQRLAAAAQAMPQPEFSIPTQQAMTQSPYEPSQMPVQEEAAMPEEFEPESTEEGEYPDVDTGDQELDGFGVYNFGETRLEQMKEKYLPDVKKLATTKAEKLISKYKTKQNIQTDQGVKTEAVDTSTIYTVLGLGAVIGLFYALKKGRK